MARVVILPGVLGSRMDLDRWIADTPYWLDPFQLFLNGPYPMAVNAAGTGDLGGPGFRATKIVGILAQYYGPIVAYFSRLGHQVLPAAYDWRLGVQLVSAGLWPQIRAWAGNDPVYLVGHSLGGLVGRGIIRAATDAGQDGQIVRLVTLGTPQQGSLNVPRIWSRIDLWYRLLADLFVPRGAFDQVLAGDVSKRSPLDVVLGTFPVLYSLFPQPGSPTFENPADYAVLMSDAPYLGCNQALSSDRFAAAKLEHAWLQASVYPAKQVSVIGTGLSTAYKFADLTRLCSRDGYLAGPVGDSTVDQYSASLPNVPAVTVWGVEHQALPYTPSVLALLPALLFQGHA